MAPCSSTIEIVGSKVRDCPPLASLHSRIWWDTWDRGSPPLPVQSSESNEEHRSYPCPHALMSLWGFLISWSCATSERKERIFAPSIATSYSLIFSRNNDWASWIYLCDTFLWNPAFWLKNELYFQDTGVNAGNLPRYEGVAGSGQSRYDTRASYAVALGLVGHQARNGW